MYPSVRAHRDQNPSVLQQSSPPPRRTWRLWLLLPLLLLSAKPLGWAQPDNDLFVHRTRLAGTDLSLLASGTDAGLD